MTETTVHYYRIDMEYIAETSVVVAAASVEQANDLMATTVNPNVKYTIVRTVELSEKEKNELLAQQSWTDHSEERTLN